MDDNARQEQEQRPAVDYQQTAQGYQPGVQYQQGVPGKGMAIASMVLGIVSLVFIPLFPILPPFTSIIGLILGIVAINRLPQGTRGMAIAGVVCSSIALVIVILGALFVGGIVASLASSSGHW